MGHYYVLKNFGESVIIPSMENVTAIYNFSQPGGINREELQEGLAKFNFGNTWSSCPADVVCEVDEFEVKNPKNVFLWDHDYQPPRLRKQGAGSFRRLPWGYESTNCGIRTGLEMWENGTKYYDKDKKCVTHVIVPLKKVEPDDFSHIKQRTRFSRLKTVITILRKVVPSNLKLHDGYEEYIVPFLETVIRAQNRKNKTKVRRIQFMTWHRYLKKYTGPISH